MSTPFQFSPPEPVFGGAAPGPAAPEQPPSSLPVFSMPVGASSASAAFLTGSSTPAFAPFTFGAQPVPSPVFASATTPQPHPQPNHTTTPALSEQRPTEGQAPMTDAESPIQALVSMGFSGILASQALAACDNSLERAVYWCLNRVSEPTAPASQSKLFSESSRAFEKKKERPREKKKRDSEMDGEEEENREQKAKIVVRNISAVLEMIGSQLMVWQSEDERMLSPSEKAMEALLSEVKELLIASLSRIKDLEGELLSREATDQLASLLMSTGEGPKSPAKKGRPSDVGE